MSPSLAITHNHDGGSERRVLREAPLDKQRRGLRPRDFPTMIFNQHGTTTQGRSKISCLSAKTGQPTDCRGLGRNIECTYQHTFLDHNNGQPEDDIFWCKTASVNGDWEMLQHEMICAGSAFPGDLDIDSPDSCRLVVQIRTPDDNATLPPWLAMALIILFVLLLVFCLFSGATSSSPSNHYSYYSLGRSSSSPSSGSSSWSGSTGSTRRE